MPFRVLERVRLAGLETLATIAAPSKVRSSAARRSLSNLCPQVDPYWHSQGRGSRIKKLAE